MIKKIKVSELKKYTNNPRKMDDVTYNQLVNSIKSFGDAEVLVVNKNNEVIGGNHRLDAFIEVFGLDYEAECKVIDLPKAQEIKLNIALNGISGEFNTDMLRDILVELDEQGEDLHNIGFDDVELNIITEGLADLKSDFAHEDVNKIDKSKVRTVTCPYCGKSFIKEISSGKQIYDDITA